MDKTAKKFPKPKEGETSLLIIGLLIFLISCLSVCQSTIAPFIKSDRTLDSD